MLTPAIPWGKRDTTVLYNLSVLALADARPAAVTVLWRGAALYPQLPFLTPCRSSSFHHPFPGRIQPIIKCKCLVTARGSSWANSSQDHSNKQNILSLFTGFLPPAPAGFAPVSIHFLSTLVAWCLFWKIPGSGRAE